MNESKKMALLAVEALEDKKAEDITIIDISEVSVIVISSAFLSSNASTARR